MQKLIHNFVLLGLVFGGSGCDRTSDESAPGPPEVEALEQGSGDFASSEGSSEEPLAEVVEPEPELEPDPQVFLPEFIAPTAASTAFALGPAGGTLRAGDLSLEVPEGALAESTTIEIEVLATAEDLDRPLPGSLPLGAFRGAPWDPHLSRAARLRVPLTRRVEPGTNLELLGWQPAMRAFIVAGRGRADETGRYATFSVRQLGRLFVRATPERSPRAELACPGETFALHEAWPVRSEDDAVGLTEVSTRYPRELAFSLLTDFRLSPVYEHVDFKNEEVNDLGATSRNELDHQDEDYLMDPNAAAAVTALAALVANEWIDPVSGESAVRVRITESYDSLIEHSPRSSHYQGRAIDLTLSPIPAASGEERRQWYGRLARLSVCAGFDWVLFENQFHVHASVVPTEYGFAVRDDDGGVTLATGGLGQIRNVRTRAQRWADPAELESVRWLGGGRVQSAEAAAETNAGASFASVAESADGLRQIVVSDGRAYLTNTTPLPGLGSVNADGTPVDVEYPLALTPPEMEVLGASFARHRSDEPVERHVLGARD
ncbi:MAG: hypothetical protein ACJAYU_003617 [Bradymonadia bacterium]|jgi:hypothetical protein